MQYISELAVARAKNAVFQEDDCMQSDPLTVPAAHLCFTSCSLTAYREDLGFNYSRIAPPGEAASPPGAVEMAQWLVANRVWLQSIRAQLPEVVTVVSVRFGQVKPPIRVCCNSCNYFFAVNACNKKIV